MGPACRDGGGCEYLPSSGFEILTRLFSFILQGAITVVIALVAYITIVNFPEKAHKTFGLKFLNENEGKWIVARLQADREDVYAEK